MKHIPGITSHARERMQQHHGRDLTADEWREVMLAILDRRAVLITRFPDGVEALVVEVGALRFAVAYSPSEAMIRTVFAEARPHFVATYTQRAGQMRRQLQRGKTLHTWHRGSKRKSGWMPNRDLRGRLATADEDIGE